MHINMKKSMSRWGMRICGFVLVVLLIYIALYYGKQVLANWQYANMQDEIVEIPKARNIQEEQPDVMEKAANEAVAPDVDMSLRKENTIDFEKLKETNEDIYAWIEVPGTLVDYPVLQHPEDNAYYLNHTVERMEGLPGSIYSENIHPKDFSAVNTVLYGHNMKNDSMFGSLHDYEDETFFEENPYVYIYLPNRTLIYRIFAAVKFSDAYLPALHVYGRKEEFDSYIEEIREHAVCLDEDVEVPFGSKVLTLSTCIANDAEHRFLVEAVLIVDYEKQMEENFP